MESTNVNILVSKMVVGKKEHINFRELIRICVWKKIYVKTRKGVQGNKHYYYYFSYKGICNVFFFNKFEFFQNFLKFLKILFSKHIQGYNRVIVSLITRNFFEYGVKSCYKTYPITVKLRSFFKISKKFYKRKFYFNSHRS